MVATYSPGGVSGMQGLRGWWGPREHLRIPKGALWVVLSRHLFEGQPADTLSLPTGIVLLQPLANGKVAGAPAD